MRDPDGDLITEARHPGTSGLDCMTPLELVRAMNREDAAAVAAVGAEAERIAAAIERVAARMAQGGRLVYIGAGTSGRLGVLDAVECLPTFSAPTGTVIGVMAGGQSALALSVEGAEDDAGAGERALRELAVSAQDSVVGISASGRAPFVVGALRWARGAGALTIALACNPRPAIAAAADVAIVPVVGPEVLAGSTRLKAGTATKLVLNTLSTGVMARLGKCYENLMVDLQATNEKLRGRARRIVAASTGLSLAEATSVLDRCDGEVKTAIVAALADVTPAAARVRLQASGGRVRSALQGPG
jgi:N-acetylmuramic acid 6-phosphate etherase